MSAAAQNRGCSPRRGDEGQVFCATLQEPQSEEAIMTNQYIGPGRSQIRVRNSRPVAELTGFATDVLLRALRAWPQAPQDDLAAQPQPACPALRTNRHRDHPGQPRLPPGPAAQARHHHRPAQTRPHPARGPHHRRRPATSVPDVQPVAVYHRPLRRGRTAPTRRTTRPEATAQLSVQATVGEAAGSDVVPGHWPVASDGAVDPTAAVFVRENRYWMFRSGSST